MALIAIAVAAGIGGLWWSQQRSEPYFVSGLFEADQIRVGSRIGGRVSEVLVHEGQGVKRGDVLIHLEPYDLRERLAQAQATLAANQAALARLEAGFRAEEVAQARARRDAAQATLDQLVAGPRPLELQILRDKLAVAEADRINAEREYDRLKALHAQDLSVQKEMDDVVRTLSVAQAREAAARDELALAEEGTRVEELAAARAHLAEAEQALSLLERGYRSEDIAEARAHAEAARSAVEVIQRQLDELALVAPADSTVEAVELQPGDLIAPNAPVISLLVSGSLYVRAYVAEDRLDLRVGQEVTLRVDSFPERRFAGHVSFIARDAEFTPSNIQTRERRVEQVFRIKVQLDEGHDVLRAGMSADVFFDQG